MVKARNHLRLAYDLFEDMGAHAFADRIAAELGAAGDPSAAGPAGKTPPS
jgi:hypothetical protein